jgi:site-specific DNA-adenine methylase
MKYVGSKNSLSKELIPIIQSYINENTIGYLEPFVGGANVIDKIKRHNKIGCDIHKELIALLKFIQLNIIPIETISEQEYNSVKDNKNYYPCWYVGLVGFCATFGSKYFGGYARGFKEDKITPRDLPNEAIRNLRQQVPNLNNIKFVHLNFLDIPKEKLTNYVINCDIPYQGTTKYKTEEFPYDKFWNWCRELSKNNIVLISEYNAPDDFVCIWQKKHKTTLRIDEHKERIEKLFTYYKNNN